MYIQVRQNSCDIVQQNPVAAHNVKILRAEPFLIIVQDKGNPVHGNGSFSGSRHSLDNDVVVGGLADDIVLLFLDGGHNLSQHSLLVSCQVLGEQLVVGHHRTVKVIQKFPLFNLVSPLHFQVDLHLSVARGHVAALAQAVLVVDIGHRGPPVHHYLVSAVPGDASLADIEGFFLSQSLIVKDDSAEVRFFLCLFIPLHSHFHVVMQGNGVGQDDVNLSIIVVVVFQHLVDFRLHSADLLSIVCQICLDDRERLLQESFLSLPGCSRYLLARLVFFSVFFLIHFQPPGPVHGRLYKSIAKKKNNARLFFPYLL